MTYSYKQPDNEIDAWLQEVMADIAVGYNYFYGVFVDADCEKAAAILENAQAFIDEKKQLLASRKEDAYGHFTGREGDIEILLCKYRDIKPYWKPALQGNAEAQFRVGESYYIDIGKCHDEERIQMCKQLAFEWFQKAAAQDHSGAQRRLGNCYYLGYYVKRDVKQAAMWYQKSAAQGNLDALVFLGCCYCFGIGVRPDYERAVYFWKQAAIGGNKNASRYLRYFEKMESCREEAEKGNTDAQCELAACYRSVPTMFQYEAHRVAAKWYRKAARQGLAKAQLELGTCYHDGEGVRKNDKTAFAWYKKAAAQGFGEAQWKIGECYEYGRGVAVNRKLSEKWYALAKKNGYYDWSDSVTTGLICQKPEPDGYDSFRRPESIISIMPHEKGGHALCKKLRSLRRKFAKLNGIPLRHRVCAYKGACLGTCSACDAELQYLMWEAKKIPQGPVFK